MQKYVTKRSQKPITTLDKNWITHLEKIEKYSVHGLLFEFGAGKSLAQNLYLSAIIEKQIVVDLNPMLDIALIERARRSLSQIGVKMRSSEPIEQIQDIGKYGIEYIAPYDAEKTNFADETLDVCISTNTLEHIPSDSIIRIFMELHRILKPHGIISAQIDYSDHYAHTDKSITLLNYLFYSEKEWRRYNHSCHFQNRLRHKDYAKIFTECGFSILEEKLSYDEMNIDINHKEKNIAEDDTWHATSGHFVLQKQ